MLIYEHSKQWGHSRGSAANESKVLAGELIDWRDKGLAGNLRQSHEQILSTFYNQSFALYCACTELRNLLKPAE